MKVNYKTIWEAIGGKFKDGSADMDSVDTSRDYKGVLHMLCPEFNEEEHKDSHIEYLSLKINFKDIHFSIHSGGERLDNPGKVEAIVSAATNQYGKKIKSEITHIDDDSAVVFLEAETREDDEIVYELIKKNSDEIHKISDFIQMNL